MENVAVEPGKGETAEKLSEGSRASESLMGLASCAGFFGRPTGGFMLACP